MTDPFPDSMPLADLMAVSEGREPELKRVPVERWQPGGKSRHLRLVRTPGDPEPVPLPEGSPFASMRMSDALAWVVCDCPWWHRLPFVGRRVHAALP